MRAPRIENGRDDKMLDLSKQADDFETFCMSSNAALRSSVVSAWLKWTSASKNSVSRLPSLSLRETFGMLSEERFFYPFITREMKSFCLESDFIREQPERKAGIASFFSR